MPICKREGFDNALSRNRNETFHDNEEVFFCEVTKEIFREYEDYFRHVMAINSTVWQCEATGRENLTYSEALKSEHRARKKMELFKDTLRPPVMLIIEHAKQSSLSALHAIAFKFLRSRFFVSEEVTACNTSSTYHAYTVQEIVPSVSNPPENGVYEDLDKLQYKLRRIGSTATEITVPFEKVRRHRSELTAENLQMFIKGHVTRIDGILHPKPDVYKKYVFDRKITFDKIFIGKMPHFTPAKIKRPQGSKDKKQSTINKYLMQNGETSKNSKMSTEEQKRLIQEKAEKAESKARSLKEQMERVRLEKQEKLIELERIKAEKRAKLMEKIEADCTALLTKTDDLERTDQRMLPLLNSIKTLIPTKLLGDAFMMREFIHTFAGLLSGMEVFRGNLSFYEMSRAFTVREVAGPLSDILIVLLLTIFDMQNNEDEEDGSIEYLLLREEMRRNEPYATMSLAAKAHYFAKRHYANKVNELPLDAFSLSEVIRLHLLSSGACVKDRTEKWRFTYRNGFTSSEDPGLALRLRQPHILKALKMYPVYQLPFIDIMRIVRCLMSQILTYSSVINTIEERAEQMHKTRSDLRLLVTGENRRLNKVQTQRRALLNEFNQQCLEEDFKDSAEKKKELEQKFNKKIAELQTQAERDHKMYMQQVKKLNSATFNFLTFLGMDRAYRKYYVLESMPGIFVEHSPECMDVCLSDPPLNVPTKALSLQSDLPKTRKELRSYLIKMYADEEKKADIAAKSNIKTDSTSMSLENKENQTNGPVNGVTNGHPPHKTDNETVEEHLPTQYELYMCSGDPRNCIVHDDLNADRQRWAYIWKEEEIEALINNLNSLGERESQLKEQLTILRELILEHSKKCPVDMLYVEKEKIHKGKMMVDTSRKYSRSNLGFAIGEADLNDVMCSALTNKVLQFESDIYTGDLGRLKVKDMPKWRTDVQNNTYDPQAKLQWGPLMLKHTINASGVQTDEDIESCDDCDEEELEQDFGDARKPYCDPGDGLGATLEIDSEDSVDDDISLHDSQTLRTSVKNLASALLQVEQAIERRFIKEPFGAPTKDTKDKERKTKFAASRLRQWELSLMECTSFSQIFLHLNVLHDSILWARSTNKSLCSVCRRGSDPDKMLLCDECNRGTHMFCMKPKMKSVPKGDWYCNRCERLGFQNEKIENSKNKTAQNRKRAFVEEEEVDACSETSSESESLSDQSSSSSPSNERANRRQRSSKRIKSSEIESILEEDDDDDDKDNELEDQVTASGSDEEHVSNSGADFESENDEKVCIVCFYDGSDLSCVECKDAFHLECMNLKRAPRYGFTCSKCKGKAKEGIKRKNDTIDENSEADSAEPIKRSRQSRSSLRNSLQNDGKQDLEKRSYNRRSHRRTGENLPLNSSALYELLESVMKQPQAWPFLRPVLQSEVPDYYKIIKTPMNFAKVKSKLNMGEYQLNEEVMNDIQLIFSNCDHYNVKGNEIYQAGCALEQYVIARSEELHLPFKPSDMNE